MRVIRTDLHGQTMTCTVCGEVREIPRRLLRDQEQLLYLQDDLEHDHRECKSYTDVRLAINARAFRKRLEREMARSKSSLQVKTERRWAA